MLRNCLAVVVILSLLPGLGARADERKEIENQLNELYKGKIVTLRKFHRGNRLHFDAKGNLLKGGKPGPWTLYGKVEIADVSLRKESLRLRGSRIFMLFDDELGDFRYLRAGGVTLDIEVSSENLSYGALNRQLESVLMSPEELITDEHRQTWKDYLAERTTGQSTGRSRNQATEVTQTDTLPPKCISCPDPEYPPEARRGRVEGLVVVWVIIDEEGRVRTVRLKKSLGMGLDEAAVKAVREWRFEPARKAGQPVPAYMHVEVNFHLR